MQDTVHDKPPIRMKSKKTGYEYEAVQDDGETRVLGEGSFGTVIQAKNVTEDKSVAIKSTVKTGEEEIELMSGIPEHENVVKLLDHWTTSPWGGINQSFYLVMDLADFDMHYFVESILSPENDQKEGLQTSTDLRKYANMLTCGVKHLHENKILHRDLKPANVLVYEIENEDGDFDYVLKITDFGISKKLEGTFHAGTTRAGTDRYMAPEVAISGRRYTNKVDYWSLGLVLYYLITGRTR